MSGFILLLKEFIYTCTLFKHSEGFAQIFVHYLFLNIGQVKLSMDKYHMAIYLPLGKYKLLLIPTPDRGQSNTLSTMTNTGQKSTETVFFIAICCQCGDKWQSKTLFLTIFDICSSIVLVFSIATYPVRFHTPGLALCLLPH